MNGMYQPGDVLGKWTLTRLIGEGAYGKVFEAQREDYGMTYTAAIKIITIPQNESEIKSAKAEGMEGDSLTQYFRSFVEEIVREFSLMSRLKGTANIVSYEDHDVIPHENGLGWDILIRMELLTPLMDYIAENKFTRKNAIQLGIDLCRALELCQKFNIIHRDIKPENVFVSELGDFKLGDFGIARTVEKTTNVLSKRGTFSYMAPEVYRAGTYGSSVDIYSLGLVMYRLLNDNRLPFLPEYPAPITHSERETALTKRMSGVPLPPPRNVDGRLAEIILKACTYDPKDRYSSPALMRQELEAILYSSGEATIIYPLGDEAPLRSVDYIAEEAPLPEGNKADIGSHEEVYGNSYSAQPVKERVEEKTSSVFAIEPKIEEKTDSIFSATSTSEKIGCTVSDAVATETAGSILADIQLSEKIESEFHEVTTTDSSEITPKVAAKHKKGNLVKIIGIAGAAVIVLVVIMVIWIGGKQPEVPIGKVGIESQDPEKPVVEWSEWISELPRGINSDDYIIEARTIYRSAPARKSTESDIPDPGYSLYNISYGVFGEWSDWQEDEVIESDSVEVETETRYQHLQYYTYTYYVTAPNGTQWPRQGTGSRWVDGYNANSSNNQSWTEYRYREREVTYYFCRNGDWSEFSATPILPSATVAVNTASEYRYIPKPSHVQTSASMSNFPVQLEDYAGCFVDVDDEKWYGSRGSGCIGVAVQVGALMPDEYMAFHPEESITIAEVIKAAVVINRIYNGEQGILAETAVWYQVYVDYAIDHDMIGFADFPDYTAQATRAETAYIMRSALPSAELTGINIVTSITDMETDSKFFKSVYQLAQAGVITWPEPEYTFEPNNPITRAQVAAFVYRLIVPEKRFGAE